MGTISYADYVHADAATREAWDAQVLKAGSVSNMKKTLLHNLPTYRAYQEWYPVAEEAEAIVGKRGVILFCHAISTANECLLCSTYFRKDLKDLGEDPDALALSDQDQLLVDFGRAAALQAAQFPLNLLERLKAVYNERELTVLTGFAGLMIATNIFNSILRVDVDDHLLKFRPWVPEESHG